MVPITLLGNARVAFIARSIFGSNEGGEPGGIYGVAVADITEVGFVPVRYLMTWMV